MDFLYLIFYRFSNLYRVGGVLRRAVQNEPQQRIVGGIVRDFRAHPYDCLFMYPE